MIKEPINKKGCKYCNFTSNVTSLELPTKNLESSEGDGWITANIYKNNSEYWIYIEQDSYWVTSSVNVPIKYCPMCGRKLS